ncbi:MAG: site-specific integrase [Bacteriovoracaceae bacterium]|nr:site-specific integrase [Bacteriovoracaceae bacterium]
MQVIKTRNGLRYREKIYIDGTPLHSPRFVRKTDAVSWKARMMSEKGRYLATGEKSRALKADIEETTVQDYAQMWLETRVKPQLATRTYEHYQYVLKRHIYPLFGELYLHDIKILHADKLIQKLSQSQHNAGGINLIVGVFKRLMIEAVKEGRIDKNPFQYLRELKEPPRPDTFLSLDEINKVLDASRKSYFYSLFLVAINTGLRRGEMAGLCWDKVSFSRNLIEISRLRDRKGLGERTKTIKSRRFIPMNAVVRNHLLKLKEKAVSDLVFLDDENVPFDVDHLYRDFRKFLKLANISSVYRFHDLRHTFASHFMMNGGNIYDLQKILGHTSLEMTQRYAHLAPEHLVEAINVVNFGASLTEVKLALQK